MPESAARAGSRGERRPPKAERRAAVRYPSALLGSCHTVRGDDLWTARVRDVSAAGIGLVLRRRFEPGTVLAVEPLGGGPLTPPYLLARVVHATEQPGGRWLLGCEFLRALGQDEVAALR